MKSLIIAVRLHMFMMVLLGLVYPFVMTGAAQVIFPRQASGDLLLRGEQVVGSALIGQSFSKPEYFWSRPSAIGYNPLPSGGSNLSQSSSALKKKWDERKAVLMAANPEALMDPPQDLLFASASGLDPHISVQAARYQLLRVAKNRHLTTEQVEKLILQSTVRPSWGIFRETAVNVLALNLSLDHIQK